MKQRIAIFGGSFNPVTKAHLAIAQFALNELKLDKLIFVPAYQSPFKKGQSLVSGQDRIAMINLVLKPKMSCSSFEIDRQGISYTIDTVKYFKNKYPEAELFWIIGTDHLSKLNKWKAIEQISQLVQLVAFVRNQTISKMNLKKFGVLLLKNPIFPEASSRFLQGHFDYVADPVRAYIGQKQLYFEQILEQILSQKRYRHSLHARNYAIKLAKALNFDVKTAAFSALVHDIAKEWPLEQAIKLLQMYQPEKTKVAKHELHQEVGALILKHFFAIDKAICRSVQVHTTLALELSMLDKIVFMADKLCTGRKWIGIQKIRNLSLSDFDQAFSLVVQQTWDFNLAKGIRFSPEQIAIYEKWMAKKN